MNPLELAPPLVRIRQRFPASPQPDLAALIPAQLAPALTGIKPGTRIAIAAGSRGISNLAAIVAATIAAVRRAGGDPFILPAMGSHGGGTPAGQTDLLASYGVTAAALGAPIRAAMEVSVVGMAETGSEVLCSTEALAADGVILLNRIKPHTDFAGTIGSGLLKMLVVGLGKHAGAAAFHQVASRVGYEPVLRAHAAVLLGRVPLLAGVALLEDQRHATARVEVVRPADFVARETALCAEARALMPRLPFDDVDLLIVDQIGKNISGTGMDPAVIGRSIHGYSLAHDPDRPGPAPRVRRLFVRGLTPETHGNAVGIGLADFTTEPVLRAMDRGITTVNALTALSLQSAKIPLTFPDDRTALERALVTLALPDPRAARIARIRNTLALEELEVSTPMLPELGARADLEVLGEPAPFAFDAEGSLRPHAG